MMSTTIAEDVISCLESFKSVASVSYTDSHSHTRPKKPEEKIADELSRFEAWCGNTGAHQRDQRSLDYRLRDASHLISQVKSLLEDIKGSLENDPENVLNSIAYSILDGTKIPWDQEVPDEEDDDEWISGLEADDVGFSTEMDQISADVAEVIDCLMNLSVSIQHPAPHDRLCVWLDTGNPSQGPTDIAHIQAEFEDADPRLATLLGQANIRRRQYFKYRKELHHQKLIESSIQDLNTSKSTSARQDPLVVSGPDAIGADRLWLTDTTLTSEDLSDSGFTQTSDASSNVKSEVSRFPELPSRSADGTIQCPFCFMTITVTTSYAWQKHILADLRPYSCIAVDCPVAGTEFEGRHEWMEHMLQSHCLEWRCVFCVHEPFPTTSSFRRHLSRRHANLVSTSERATMISNCEWPGPFGVNTRCPLCHDSLESVEIYRQHVGRHLEDIALFVITDIVGESEDLENQNSLVDIVYPYTEREVMEKVESPMVSDTAGGGIEISRHGEHIQPERSSNNAEVGSQRNLYPLGDNKGTDSTGRKVLKVEDPTELREANIAVAQDRTIAPSRKATVLPSNPMVSSQQNDESIDSEQKNIRAQTGLPKVKGLSGIPGESHRSNTLSAGPRSAVEANTNNWRRQSHGPTRSTKDLVPQHDAKQVAGNSFDMETRAESGHEKAENPTVAKVVEPSKSRAEKQQVYNRERTVRFREESLPRKSPRSRDSGLGSSIEQTSRGGLSDRYFTTQDYDIQRFNIGALQEALDSCLEEMRRYKSRAYDLDAQLQACKTAVHEKELHIRNLEEENLQLRFQRDSYEREINDIRRRTGSISENIDHVREGTGESSGNSGGSRSKHHESQEQKNRLLERMNYVNTESIRDSTRRRQSSVSQPRVPFTTEDNRIPRGPPVTTRGFDRIPPATPATPAASSSSTSEPGTSTTTNTSISGYSPVVPKLKAESKSSSSRKHRYH